MHQYIMTKSLTPIGAKTNSDPINHIDPIHRLEQVYMESSLLHACDGEVKRLMMVFYKINDILHKKLVRPQGLIN